MELDLSLGDSSRPFEFIEKPHEAPNEIGLGGFNNTTILLSIGPVITEQSDRDDLEGETTKIKQKHNSHNTTELEEDHGATNKYHIISSNPKANSNTSILELDLLPHTPSIAPINPLPILSFPWHPPFENGVSGGSGPRGLDVNKLPAAAVAVEDEAEEVAALSSSSPHSTASSFHQMELSIYKNRGGGSSVNNNGERGYYDQIQRGNNSPSPRASDEDESGGSTRKKLRLSKEQSNFLEESFKEHNTLNPKQKLALAKQLHLRPRQVEVWFQNRRARTKLKQTEVDCEYLKSCCETLTEENRRLHKELQELRALKTSTPFSMQLPTTTLTMCPSCERVATNSNSTPTSSSATTITNINTSNNINEPTSKANSIGFPLDKPIRVFLH
ncbi:hypothetical protein RIF29_13592 [Crotalaria pallida]|uniref:Homeobox domain-containing protein n=1 Tax=Crotalaria pallida TaxID=3830 RepID=A0AAN9IPM2_CROPI